MGVGCAVPDPVGGAVEGGEGERNVELSVVGVCDAVDVSEEDGVCVFGATADGRLSEVVEGD